MQVKKKNGIHFFVNKNTIIACNKSHYNGMNVPNDDKHENQFETVLVRWHISYINIIVINI